MTFYCKINYNFPNSTNKLQLEFTLENSDILFLEGPNASGKTTLFNIINGFIVANEGFITLNNRILFNDKKNINVKPQKRNITQVFQNYSLFPNMNVKNNLQFANKDTVLLNSLIKTFNLQPLLNKNINNLSGGQQQKIAIIQNLINKPQLLLLDEAFSNLDNQTTILFKNIIKNLKIPVIFTSHNLQDTFNFITKTININKI